MQPNVRKYVVNGNEIIFSVCLASVSKRPIVQARLSYTFCKEGVKIGVRYELQQTHYFDYLPRIGFAIKTDKKYDKVKYLAYGPYETYADSYDFAFKGEYAGSVNEQYHHYVKPQESGNYRRKALYPCGGNAVVFGVAVFGGNVGKYGARRRVARNGRHVFLHGYCYERSGFQFLRTDSA